MAFTCSSTSRKPTPASAPTNKRSLSFAERPARPESASPMFAASRWRRARAEAGASTAVATAFGAVGPGLVMQFTSCRQCPIKRPTGSILHTKSGNPGRHRWAPRWLRVGSAASTRRLCRRVQLEVRDVHRAATVKSGIGAPSGVRSRNWAPPSHARREYRLVDGLIGLCGGRRAPELWADTDVVDEAAAGSRCARNRTSQRSIGETTRRGRPSSQGLGASTRAIRGRQAPDQNSQDFLSKLSPGEGPCHPRLSGARRQRQYISGLPPKNGAPPHAVCCRLRICRVTSRTLFGPRPRGGKGSSRTGSASETTLS